jgi:hypothetical protein
LKDYEYFKKFLKNLKCSICNESFTEINKPTLNRKNNKIGHTKENLVPCCGYCNCVKADRDESYTKLHIQLRKYAIQNHLPFTFAKNDEEEYEVTRKNITGELSNVHNEKI